MIIYFLMGTILKFAIKIIFLISNKYKVIYKIYQIKSKLYTILNLF